MSRAVLLEYIKNQSHQLYLNDMLFDILVKNNWYESYGKKTIPKKP